MGMNDEILLQADGRHETRHVLRKTGLIRGNRASPLGDEGNRTSADHGFAADTPRLKAAKDPRARPHAHNLLFIPL